MARLPVRGAIVVPVRADASFRRAPRSQSAVRCGAYAGGNRPQCIRMRETGRRRAGDTGYGRARAGGAGRPRAAGSRGRAERDRAAVPRHDRGDAVGKAPARPVLTSPDHARRRGGNDALASGGARIPGARRVDAAMPPVVCCRCNTCAAARRRPAALSVSPARSRRLRADCRGRGPDRRPRRANPLFACRTTRARVAAGGAGGGGRVHSLR